MKNVIIGGIFGVIAYFIIFKMLNLNGKIGWIIFFILGVLIIYIISKLSKNRQNNSSQKSEYRNYNANISNQIVTKETLLNELNDAEIIFNNNSFYIIKEIMLNGINKQYNEIIELLNSNGRRPREWVYSLIGNKAGDLLETGKYHAYRGLLDMNGKDLLEIFDKSYDLLLQMNIKDIDLEYANEQKATLRRNIKQVG
jgi:hypothetical protein